MPLSNTPNHFLVSLSAHDAALIEPHLKPLELPSGTILYKAEENVERVYFPHKGIISLIVGLSNGQYVEAGMLGWNGVVGAGAASDGPIALNTAIAQADSFGMFIEARVLKGLARQSEPLRTALISH